MLGLANRLALPRRIVDFCGTFPIYNAAKVPLDSMNPTIYNIQGKTSSSSSSFLLVRQSCIFTFLDGGRERRDFPITTIKYCTPEDGQSIEDCANKVGGYNFKLQCKYRHASCFYVAECRHVAAQTLSGEYNCTAIHHEVDVKTLCCKGIC